MTGPVTISDGLAEVIVWPDWGAGLGRYDFLIDGLRQPILRPAPQKPDDPFKLALNLLIPWSNRISGGGFLHDDMFHALAPNLYNEPFPIHGDAFVGVWQITAVMADAVELTFVNKGVGPFFYEAIVTYRLAAGALTMRLSITSRSKLSLPFGFGFHPWFFRSGDTWLWAPAETVWLEDERHLPTREVAASDWPDWDFSIVRPLPTNWINNGFEGWKGAARIEWRDRGLRVSIAGGPELSTYVVYSPSALAEFICFEPVSHPVDAHNLAANDWSRGLRILAPGERVETWCRLTPERLVDHGKTN